MLVFKVNDELQIDYTCRGFCKLPYPGHSKGCPNFGKNINCPPKAHFIDEFFNLDKHCWFIIEEFNLEEHVERMEIKHPDWTIRQLRNCLYWQGKVRKSLKQQTEQFILLRNDRELLHYTLLPEAMGVLVIRTAKKLGVPIKKHPINRIFKIAMVGYKK